MSKKPKHELENNKLQKRLRHAVGDAINDFNMIENGDKIMVCLSGGKDSYALLDILRQLQASAPIEFELVAVNLDQKQPGFPEHVLPEYLSSIGVPYKIVEEDTYSTVKRVLDEGKTTCSLCSRLRRGILYRTAKELGCTKIALGHHRDDIIATLFLNMFYGGKLKAMPPKLVSDNGEHIVIRPLAYVKEKDLIKYAELKQFPIIPCNLCGSQPNLQRQVIGDMLKDWDKRFPGRIESMFSALQNVVPSHLADTELFDFAGFGKVCFEARIHFQLGLNRFQNRIGLVDAVHHQQDVVLLPRYHAPQRKQARHHRRFRLSARCGCGFERVVFAAQHGGQGFEQVFVQLRLVGAAHIMREVMVYEILITRHRVKYPAPPLGNGSGRRVEAFHFRLDGAAQVGGHCGQALDKFLCFHAVSFLSKKNLFLLHVF